MSVDTRTEQQRSELAWFKSSCSGTSGGDCIEVAPTPATVHVRDSKRLLAASLTFSAEQWSAFATYAGQA
ncbi:DUF397 domain-containing protein [Streptomyces sp. NBC_00117]